MINLFIFSMFSSLSFGQCEYNVNQVTVHNTFEPAYIPSLIQHSKGCTTLVELWASWCGPCRRITPHIDELVTEYPDLVLHQISADEKIPAMKKFVEQNPLHSPPYRLSSWTLDALSTSFAQVGGEFESAIPYFVLISPDGRVVLELTEPKNLDSIKTYLSKNPPPKKKENIQKTEPIQKK